MEPNNVVEHKILSALESHDVLYSGRIKISVSSVRVTLSGQVSNYIERQMAECLVRRIAADRAFRNMLRVVFVSYSIDPKVARRALKVTQRRLKFTGSQSTLVLGHEPHLRKV